MCRQTAANFGCGHQTVRLEICSTASFNTKIKIHCDKILTYAPRQRTDPCIDCSTKQMGLAEVTDWPKGGGLRVPRKYNSVTHSRRLFKQHTPTGDPVEDAMALQWTPQKYRADLESVKQALDAAQVGGLTASKSNPRATQNPAMTAKKSTKTPAKKDAAKPAVGKGKK